MWWVTASGGIKKMTMADESEISLIKGESTSSIPPQGQPTMWAYQPPAIQGSSNDGLGLQGQYQVWPAPDGNGPQGGNYQLNLDYYAELPQIVECTSTTTASNSTVTLAANVGNYLLANGLPATNNFGSSVSIRDAAWPTGIVANNTDDFTWYWNTISANSFVLQGATQPAVTLGAPGQTFFNSRNWLIRSFPHVLLYGMLVEIGAYLGDARMDKWGQRFEQEYEKLEQWDDDTENGVEVLASAIAGQLQPQFRDMDLPMLYEIRGQ